MEIPAGLSIADTHTNAELQGNLLQDYEHKFEQLLEDRKLWKLSSDGGLKIVEKDNSSLHLIQLDLMKWRICVESTRYF